MGMEKREQRDKERIEAVLKILKKQAPLTVKQEKYCNDACVERFLKGKGDNVKKAAKQLRTVLSWREAIGTDHLIADEFSSELAEGVAYVAGHDDEARPVMVFRIKHDYFKFHTQKSYLRLLVFTLEVAIASMSRFVDQFVLLFDASFFRSAPACLNLFMGTLKVISEFYPARLHRAFVIDPPSMFSCLWKGARPFVDLWAVTSVVSSLDYDDPLEDFSSYPHRTTSLRFDPASIKSNGRSGSTSSRFAFTVSHLDSLKPWYLSSVVPTANPSSRPSAVPPSASPSLVGVSPLNARSYSFASPSARTPRPQRTPGHHQQQQPRTPRPSFLQSPAAALFSGFSRKESNGGGSGGGSGKAGRDHQKRRESLFVMYLRFYRRPYDEMVYRSKMWPPLGGLVSIVLPHGKQQRRCAGGQLQRIHHEK